MNKYNYSAMSWIKENYPNVDKQTSLIIYDAFIAGQKSITEPDKSPSEIIVEEVCKYYKIPIPRIFNKTRKRNIVQARQVVMYFYLNYKLGSLTEAGDIFSKDHATALHSKKTVENLIETNIIIKRQIADIESILKKKIELWIKR